MAISASIANYYMNAKTVRTLIQDLNNSERVDLNPNYQRNIVWSDKDESAYIDSVIHGMAPGNIIFAKDNEKKICIDGKQRCFSLLHFSNNEVPIIIDQQEFYYGPTEDDLPKKNDGLEVKLLPKNMRVVFEEQQLNIVTYDNLDYNQQAELFTRIQYGKKLTCGEKTSAKIKNEKVCSIMAKYCETHKEKLQFYYGERKEYYQFISKMFCILHKEDTAVSKTNIDKYLNKLNKSDVKEQGKKLDKIINNLFTDSILNSDEIRNWKLKTNLPMLCYKIYDRILKDKDVLSSKDIKTIKEIIIGVAKDILDKKIKGATKKVQRLMAKQCDESINTIMEDISESGYSDDESGDASENNSNNASEENISVNVKNKDKKTKANRVDVIYPKIKNTTKEPKKKRKIG